MHRLQRISQQQTMEPLQLIDTGPSKSEMILKLDVLEMIASEQRPITAISIIGLARQGKSYLMNRLMRKNKGFPLGSTVCSKTKGFWLWKGDFLDDPSRCLVLLDIEGLGDPKKCNQGTHDLKLFTLALLSSSMLIYNSIGTIDASALNSLHLVTKVVDDLMPADAQSESTDFGQYFPHFVWTIRDHFLEMKDECGKEITPKEFLEECLKPEIAPTDASWDQKMKIEEYNETRGTLREFFPQRACFIFPRPVSDKNKMLKLDEVDDSELDPEFKAADDNFVRFVFSTAKSKDIHGSALNGRSFAQMFKKFLDSVNEQRLSIKSTYKMIAQQENLKALELAIQKFESIFEESVKFPIASENFYDLSRHAREVCHAFFLENSIDIKRKPETLDHLELKLTEKVLALEKANIEASTKLCRSILKELYKPIDSKEYMIDGGYDQLKSDIDQLKKKFEDEGEGIGPAKHDVLQEFQSHTLDPLLHRVVICDQLMTEMKKKEAEVRQLAKRQEEENKRIKDEIKALEAQKNAQRIAAENNHKLTLEKMERDHKENMEHMKKNYLNLEMEVNRFRNDATAREEFTRQLDEILAQQKAKEEKMEREMEKLRREIIEKAAAAARSTESEREFGVASLVQTVGDVASILSNGSKIVRQISRSILK